MLPAEEYTAVLNHHFQEFNILCEGFLKQKLQNNLDISLYLV